MYSGLIWGVLPLRVGVSWQGHLFGFIGGCLGSLPVDIKEAQTYLQGLKYRMTTALVA